MKPVPRVVLFGTGSPLSTQAFEALAQRFPVLAVVVPVRRPLRGLRSAARWLLSRRARRPLERLARQRRVPVVPHAPSSVGEMGARLRGIGPDLICVASFPHLLQPSLLGIPRLGAMGVHPSLLPRRRGPDPLFWTYFYDDAEAGVSVYWLDEGEDTGDIIHQQSVPLPRGQSAVDLYETIARRGARLLVRSVEEAAAGCAPRTPQREEHASREPMPWPGSWRIDYSTWGSARLWHFLSGLGTCSARLLTDAEGRTLMHGRAVGFRLERHDLPPGTIERSGSVWRVACHDGIVEVAGPSLRMRVIATARRVLGGLGSGAAASPEQI